jgi:hypothetical protein
MDDKTPSHVRDVLPEVIEQLALHNPNRARALMEALRGDGPPPCICGSHAGSQSTSGCEAHDLD